MKIVSQIDKTLAVLVLPSTLIVAAGCQNSHTSEVPAARRSEATSARTTLTTLEANLPADPDCCTTEPPAAPKIAAQTPKIEVVARKVPIPDVTLINQDGQSVNVARDLAPGKLLVMNFIFTTCKGVCPPMGVNFGELQRRLGDRLGQDVHLVSISVDPITDTPERLKTWSAQFGAAPGWTLLTGQKQDVDHLLKALGVFTANKSEHSPFILMGRASEGSWQRIHGLTPSDKLSDLVISMLDSKPEPVQTGLPSHAKENGNTASTDSPAQRYFTDVPLIDQDGRPLRLYSDVLKGKVVVITPFFTSCRASCPKLIDTFVKLQAHFEDRLGKDLFLVSLTVDPETDSPDKLKTYAEQLHAMPGWSFLTGQKDNVFAALSKLGQRVQAREDHSNIFVIGNERTGLWKKAMGLAPPEEVIRIVESVLNDKPS